ncbi:MAG: GlpG protein [Paraglaciecola sp.]|jgi:GlpG protein
MTQSKLLLAFGQERIARLLVNYLQNQHIQAEYVNQSGEYPHAVKLLDVLQLQLAEQIAREFVANPQDKKYQQAAWQSGSSVELHTSSSFSSQKFWQNLRQSPFTSLIVAICIVVYGLRSIGINQAYDWLAIQPIAALLENAQWWRIIGPALIHFSMLHIVFNLLWWWMLGKQIEQKFGVSNLLLLFVFSAALSNIGQLLISGPHFGGLSGVVYALVGCVWWLGWLRPDWGISLPKPMIGFLLVWLLIGYADVLWISMANTAHTVGLISGCLFAWLLVKGDKSRQKIH